MRKHDCQEQQDGNAQLWHSEEAQAPKADPIEIKLKRKNEVMDSH
jgi:hypothetical protein